jgi:adenosylcobinamide-GDP ribazoletransferase
LSVRGFILALQFLTRIPVRVSGFEPADLAASAPWFPLVGMLLGGILAVALAAGALVDPWLGALAALCAWTLVTGALHLDALADLADALGAAHRDPRRFLEALKDPHIGSFGAIAIVLVLAGKLVLLALAARVAAPLAALALVPAWARFGALLWSRTLSPLAAGSGERFARGRSRRVLAAWAVALVAASAWAAPVLAAAPLALEAWWLFLKHRLGGMSGDCLGAGIEVTEVALLAALVIAAA